MISMVNIITPAVIVPLKARWRGVRRVLNVRRNSRVSGMGIGSAVSGSGISLTSISKSSSNRLYCLSFTGFSVPGILYEHYVFSITFVTHCIKDDLIDKLLNWSAVIGEIDVRL